MTKTLIIGCGDLGRRIAARIIGRGAPVTGLVRTPQSAQQLIKRGIEVLQLDLDATLGTIDISNTIILYLAPPPRAGLTDTRLAHFLAAAGGKPQRFIYLSTTGVYGHCDGAWIDESTPTAPLADRARRRLDAERQVTEAAKKSNWETIIVRVPGIYGPGRLPLQRLREQVPLLRADLAPYTNRIHVDDLANIFVALRDQGRSGEIYNATDGQPGNMTDYFKRVADFAGLPHPPEIDMQQAEEQLSKGLISYLQESRRLSNAKLLADLDIELQYPTLDDGLKAIFADNNEHNP